MKKLFGVLCILALTNMLNAQWEQANGPWQGSVNIFANTSTTILAGTAGDGIYSSTDDGFRWRPGSMVGLTNNDIRCFLWSGTKLYAGTGGGVFLSTNNGNNWFGVNSGLNNMTVNTLIEFGANIYAGTPGGIYITTNSGVTWYSSSYGLTNPNVNCIIAYGNNLLAGTNGGVFRSTDNGNSWESSNFGLISQNVNTLLVSGSEIFAGSSYLSGAESVYKSLDGGTTWAALGLSNLTVYSLNNITTNLFACTNSGIYKSSDAGITWSNELGMAGRQVNSIFSTGLNMLTGGLDGIYISTNGGTEWDAVGYKSAYVWSLDNKGPNLWATAYHNDVFMSTNSGASWSRKTGDLNPAYRYIDIVSTESNTYVAYINNNLTNTGVFKTSNNGQNWNWANGFVNRSIMAIEVPSDSVLYFGLYYENGEFSFYGIGPNFYNIGLPNMSVWELEYKSGNIFAATSDGIYKSSDNGANWINTGIPGDNIAVDGNNIYTTCTDYSTERGIYKSTDDGGNWQLIGLTNKTIASLEVNSDIIMAGVYDEGFYVSTDNGVNWYLRNEGLDSIPSNIGDIIVENGIVFCAIDDLSLWKRSLANITSTDEIVAEIPEMFLLEQNYPNPFNPETKISWQSPVSGHQTLKVYDVLGNEVATLVDEFRNAGRYEVDFDASNLSSGVYFYQLKAGTFVETKKMILLK